MVENITIQDISVVHDIGIIVPSIHIYASFSTAMFFNYWERPDGPPPLPRINGWSTPLWRAS